MSDQDGTFEIELALTDETYQQVAEAAKEAGLEIDEFILEAATEKAARMLGIDDSTRICVSQAAADRMLQALDAPWQPNEKLLQAMVRRQN